MSTLDRVINVITDALGIRRTYDLYPSNRLGECNAERQEWLAVIVDLEREFKVSITETEFEDVETIGDLVGLIDAKLTAREAA